MSQAESCLKEVLDVAVLYTAAGLSIMHKRPRTPSLLLVFPGMLCAILDMAQPGQSTLAQHVHYSLLQARYTKGTAVVSNSPH